MASSANTSRSSVEATGTDLQRSFIHLQPPTFALTPSTGQVSNERCLAALSAAPADCIHLLPPALSSKQQLSAAHLPSSQSDDGRELGLADKPSSNDGAPPHPQLYGSFPPTLTVSNNGFAKAPTQTYGPELLAKSLSSRDSLSTRVHASNGPPVRRLSGGVGKDAVSQCSLTRPMSNVSAKTRLSGDLSVPSSTTSIAIALSSASGSPAPGSGGDCFHSSAASQADSIAFEEPVIVTPPRPNNRRHTIVTFSFNAEPFVVDPYFFGDLEQDSCPPPALPPWVSPPRPILRRPLPSTNMRTPLPGMEGSDSYHSFAEASSPNHHEKSPIRTTSALLGGNENNVQSSLPLAGRTGSPVVGSMVSSDTMSSMASSCNEEQPENRPFCPAVLRAAFQHVQELSTAWISNPDSRFWLGLDFLTRLLDIYYLLSVPVAIAFICEVTYQLFYAFAAADFLLLIVVILDMGRPRRNKYGILVTDSLERRQLYWGSVGNRFKLLACLPLDWAVFFFGLPASSWEEGFLCQNHVHVYLFANRSASLSSNSDAVLVSTTSRFMYNNHDIPPLGLMTMCFRLARVFHCVDTLYWLHDMRIPFIPRSFSRLVKNILIAMYMSLFNSCVFWFTSSRIDHPKRYINKYLVEDGIPTGFLERFVNNYVDGQKSLFFIVRNVAVVQEAAYQAVEMLMAAVVYGSIFGNLVSIVRSLDDQAAFDKTIKNRNFKKAFLRQYLIANTFPAALQQRILDQEEFDFLHKKGMDVEQIIASMPKTMQHDIHMHLYSNLIDKVPMLAKTDQAFKLALMDRISMITVQAGFYIFKAGDQGSEVYFIKQGAVDIMSRDETKTFVTLQAGAFFGEIALLEDCTRTATAKTAAETQLCALAKHDFLSILGRFPAAAELIAQAAREKREADAKRKAEEEEREKLQQQDGKVASTAHLSSLRSRLLSRRTLLGSKAVLNGESKFTLPGLASLRRGRRSIVASMRSLAGGGHSGGSRPSITGSKGSLFTQPHPPNVQVRSSLANDLADPEATIEASKASSSGSLSSHGCRRDRDATYRTASKAPSLPNVPVTPATTMVRGGVGSSGSVTNRPKSVY